VAQVMPVTGICAFRVFFILVVTANLYPVYQYIITGNRAARM